MLLKHYLERGVSKAELSRRFGVSRRTIHEWVETGQLDRDLSSCGSRHSPRAAAAHKLDPYTGIIDSPLEEFPDRRPRHRRAVETGHRPPPGARERRLHPGRGARVGGRLVRAVALAM